MSICQISLFSELRDDRLPTFSLAFTYPVMISMGSNYGHWADN